jgi:hypothetical protein
MKEELLVMRQQQEDEQKRAADAEAAAQAKVRALFIDAIRMFLCGVCAVCRLILY